MTSSGRRPAFAASTRLLCVALVPLMAAVVAADSIVGRREADSFARKVLTIAQYGEAALTGARLTPITESEFNAYLRLDLRDQLPAGVVDPSVQALGEGRLVGQATVDLDAVRRARQSGGLLDPMNLLTGRLPVTAAGVLRTEQGRARFELESASVGGIPVPKSVLQELVTYYSRSPESPRGIDLDASFALPARISEIHVDTGRAVVVQR